MIKIRTSNSPKFILKLFDLFRKWKLGKYKKKKVRQEKTKEDKAYFVKFIVKIEDPINPQESHKEYQMLIPAKAAFFAKIKAKQAIIKKIELEFVDCDLMSDEEYENFENSKDKYIQDIKEGVIAKD